MATKEKNDTPAALGENPGRDLEPGRLRLFILSDVRLVFEGLALALSQLPTVIVVGASDLSLSPAQIAEFRPDVLLLDVARPSSLEACLSLRQALPDAKIVAFAVTGVEEDVIACAEAGCDGFVSRKGSAEDLVAAVHRAVRHELLCSPRTAALLFSRMAVLSPRRVAAEGDTILTRREREIIRLLEKGLSNKEIARLLRIEHATVKNHVHSILAKLQVRRRGEAAAKIRRSDARHRDATV
jgi:two-component system nitrate/nitrite response regulator NarL